MRPGPLVAAIGILISISAPPGAAEPPAFPHGMSLFGALGWGAPFGTVDRLPGKVTFPETDASGIYRASLAFGAGIVFYDDRWMFELDAEGRAFGLLTTQGKELARPLGFLDPDSRYVVVEISAGRWHPVGRSAMIFVTVGNGIVLQRLGENGTYFHDNEYGLSLRAGATWLAGERLLVRPHLRYQAITKTIPHDLTLLVGVGVALGRGD